jgi:hypothetical protein
MSGPEGTPTPGFAPGAAARPARWWSRALVAGTTVLVACAVAAHLLATFLYNAPANPVSQRYAKPVGWWMDPLFQQNWRLFAPNPVSANLAVQARASRSGDGRVTAWFDLSALDAAATRGDPVPERQTQDALRNAWLEWAGSHDDKGDPTSAYGAIMQQYLQNLAVDRLRPLVGGQIGSIQLRAVTTLIPGPGRTPQQTSPQTRTLDWWAVA